MCVCVCVGVCMYVGVCIVRVDVCVVRVGVCVVRMGVYPFLPTSNHVAFDHPIDVVATITTVVAIVCAKFVGSVPATLRCKVLKYVTCILLVTLYQRLLFIVSYC